MSHPGASSPAAPVWSRRRTALEEEYVPVRLQVSGEDLGTVGVRYKGNVGTLSGCFDRTTGARTCAKLSLKLKFDHAQPRKRWRGLKRLNLHAMARDPSLLRERLGYQLFRDMGVPAPRAVHGRVVIDGQLQGVFAVVEAIDGRFTADRWPGRGDGTLFKEAWPGSTEARYYEERRRTNEEAPGGGERFAAFAGALAAASDEELPQVLDRWAGLDHLLRYLAVDQVISNWDGFTAFYCGGPDARYCGNHNYYFYEEEGGSRDGARFWLIPWDLDQTFSLVHGFVALPAWDEVPADCAAPLGAWGGQNRVRAPGCDRVFRGLRAAGRERYAAALGSLLDGPFQLTRLQEAIDRWAAQIAPLVREDPTLQTEAWQAHVAALKADLALLRARAETWRQGGKVTPFGLRVDGTNDLEATDPVGFAMGADVMASGGSSVARGLNRAAPLSGAADARMDFEMRNENTTNPWHHWAFMRLAFAGQPVNLTGVRRIRLRCKSNVARGVRVEIDSPRYKAPLGKFSAQVNATAEGGEVVVDLAALAFPSWGKPQGDSRQEVLASASAITLAPDVVGREGNGFFRPGASDKGWIQVDDIAFER
jgi:hypothetical protein